MPTSQEFKKAGAAKAASQEEDKDLSQPHAEDELSDTDEALPEEEIEEVELEAQPKKKSQAKKAVVASSSEDSDATHEGIGDIIEDKRYSLRPKSQMQRDFYAKQSLVQCLIPRLENEPKDAIQSFNINGYSFWIRKGVFQMVPEDIAVMIRDSYGQDANIVANHPNNLNNNEAAKKALR